MNAGHRDNVGEVFRASLEKGCNESVTRELRQKDVWADNLYDEFFAMLKTAKDYPIIAMDTEYPGTVVAVVNKNHMSYPHTVANVNLMRLIQLGLSFFDAGGNQPAGTTTWQFNFKFSITADVCAESSIAMLQNQGFIFEQHEEHGIDHQAFSELLYYSGLICNPSFRWITFHG